MRSPRAFDRDVLLSGISVNLKVPLIKPLRDDLFNDLSDYKRGREPFF